MLCWATPRCGAALRYSTKDAAPRCRPCLEFPLDRPPDVAQPPRLPPRAHRAGRRCRPYGRQKPQLHRRAGELRKTTTTERHELKARLVELEMRIEQHQRGEGTSETPRRLDWALNWPSEKRRLANPRKRRIAAHVHDFDTLGLVEGGSQGSDT